MVKTTKLVHVDLDGAEKIIKFNVAHNNGETTVDQNLILIRHPDGTWTADMKFENFPPQQAPQDAVNKLAQWMDRLTKVLLDNNFATIDLVEDLGR